MPAFTMLAARSGGFVAVLGVAILLVWLIRDPRAPREALASVGPALMAEFER